MKIILPKPEDFTEVEGYSFQLSHAYNRIYSDFCIALIELNSIKECLDETGNNQDEIGWDKEWAVKKIDEILSRHTE